MVVLPECVFIRYVPKCLQKSYMSVDQTDRTIGTSFAEANTQLSEQAHDLRRITLQSYLIVVSIRV